MLIGELASIVLLDAGPLPCRAFAAVQLQTGCLHFGGTRLSVRAKGAGPLALYHRKKRTGAESFLNRRACRELFGREITSSLRVWLPNRAIGLRRCGRIQFCL